ncbi:MAG: deaminase [Pseudonocardiales bacterium]
MSQQRDIDEHWMRRAIELSHQCPRTEGAYSVGAVITDAEGREIATGYSRETDPKVHAEESALAKLPTDDPRLKEATIYSTLEPCSQRASRPRACTQLILDAGIPRVVIAWREPSLFVENCVGVESLEQHGIHVVEMPEFADEAKGASSHLDLNS